MKDSETTGTGEETGAAAAAPQTRLEVLFTPADFSALLDRDLSGAVCVVFDVLRATSSVITALSNGAVEIIPVSEISDALAIRHREADVLLSGERDGVRIEAHLTGSISFDLGNSPREFLADAVRGRKIAMTTTNGTRALRACARARLVLISCFLNLKATADHVKASTPNDLLLVCSGTFEEAAYEDVLAAGAFCDLVWEHYRAGRVADSALLARELFLLERHDLARAFGKGRNGRRLLRRPELCEDVSFCAQTDKFDVVAVMTKDGVIRTSPGPEQLSTEKARRSAVE